MDLCLLTSFHSFHSRSSFIHRLAEEAQKRSMRLHLVNPSQVSLTIADGQTRVMYQGHELPKYDLTHYALRWDDDHTWSVVEALKTLGYFTVPSQRMPLGDSITMARLFAKHGIKTPRTWVLPHADQVPVVMQELSFPCLFRARRGQKGRSVYKVNHLGEALSLAEQLGRGTAGGLVVQELLHPLGHDVRAVVVGSKIVAAIARTAANEHLRPTEDGNATVETTELTPTEQKLVTSAARLYNAPYAAVNFLRREHSREPVLLEVARAPVLTETETASGLNIAGMIIDHLISLARK